MKMVLKLVFFQYNKCCLWKTKLVAAYWHTILCPIPRTLITFHVTVRTMFGGIYVSGNLKSKVVFIPPD